MRGRGGGRGRVLEECAEGQAGGQRASARVRMVAPGGVDDMIKLSPLTEESIRDNLKARYVRGGVYTSVGTVLLSVNPFQIIDGLYDAEVTDLYRKNGQPGQPPHVFGTADSAYRGLVTDWKAQSVIVSGESGAGKTEATKLILEYLMEMSAESGQGVAAGENADGSLEDCCMHAQTVFESFGNAATVRNDNSSRFGKWIEVLFSRGGHVEGARIRTYLLEKSRVVKVDPGERTYHIFYQLLAAAQRDEDMAQKYDLRPAQTFNYLRQSSQWEIDGGSDVDDFDRLLESLQVFSVDSAEKNALWTVLSAILHLGDVNFEMEQVKTDRIDTVGCRVTNPEALDRAARLLGVSFDALDTSLRFTSFTISSETISKPNPPDKASDARDALAKALYEGVFGWIQSVLNRGLKYSAGEAATDSRNTIGILDIFGFEIMQVNSFEQLCINYCNERLQFHFNEECFRIEQEEYRAEGISVSAVEYTDNQLCLDLLEGRPDGIFAAMDEEIFTPGGSEAKFLDKVCEAHRTQPHFDLSRSNDGESKNSFRVVHYAGTVLYSVEGMLDKNRDALHEDISTLIAGTNNSRVAGIVQARADAGGESQERAVKGKKRGSTMRHTTVGTKFSRQLGSLMERLNSTKPHFVKCLKPNAQKLPDSFEDTEMAMQLRYSGIFGLCKLRQIGYSERSTLADFFTKYRSLCPGARSFPDLTRGLQQSGELATGKWVQGHSKMMMKHDQASSLDAALGVALARLANKLQSQAKAFLFRMRLRRILKARAEARELISSADEMSIQFALEIMESLPEDGQCWPETQRAHLALKRIKEEQNATKALQLAIDAKDVEILRNSIQHAKNVGLAAPLLGDAETLLASLLEIPPEVAGGDATADGTNLASPSQQRSPNSQAPQDASSPADSWPDLESMMIEGEDFSKPAEPGDVLRAALAAGEMLSSKIESGSVLALDEVSSLGARIQHLTECREEDFSVQELLQLQELEHLRDSAKKIIECSTDLEEAMDGDDYDALLKSLDACDSVKVPAKLVSQGRVKLDSMEPPETSKEADMEKILEVARGARWRCDRYIYLRTTEDFGRSIWRPGLRRQHMNSMLSFTSLVIPTSLTRLKKAEDVKQSIALWKNLLSLAGVRKTTFPAAQAHAIVKKGASRPEMRQEIFLQIIKFVNGTSDAQKCWRGWVCMCLCISIFGPSVDFELYLLNFLLSQTEHPQIGPYASFCVRTLQAEMELDESEMYERVRRKQIPSAEYICAILNGQIANPFVPHA